MNTRLSAFMDGELSASQLDELLDEISEKESSITWRHYQIGHSLLSDDPVHSYSVSLTENIMRQISESVAETKQPATPRVAKIISFPKKLGRWAIPASIAASAAVAAIMLGSIDQNDVEMNIANSAEKPLGLSVASSKPLLKTEEEVAGSGNANDSANPTNKMAVASTLTRSLDPVENQVIPELNEFILRHNSTASSRQFQPSLSYARVVSHTSR